MSEKGTLENRPHRANLVLAGDKRKENGGAEQEGKDDSLNEELGRLGG